MSYVVNGVTYDEAGYQIDAFGHRLGGVDANVAADQPLSAVAAAAKTTVSALLASTPSTIRSTTNAVQASKIIAAAHPSATTQAPVMPTAPRVNVASASRARSRGLMDSPVLLLALGVAAYYFYKHA